MSERRETLTSPRFIGDSIRPPDPSTRAERPKAGGESAPVVIDIGLGPVTNPPAKRLFEKVTKQRNRST